MNRSGTFVATAAQCGAGKGTDNACQSYMDRVLAEFASALQDETNW